LRIELAWFQRARPFRIKHRGKTVLFEEFDQAVTIIHIATDDARPGKTPVVFSPETDHLTGIPPEEVVKCVVASHTGNAGDQQRKRWMGFNFAHSAMHQQSCSGT
jgi:hypothetical protein